jgi:hypothetical protein
MKQQISTDFYTVLTTISISKFTLNLRRGMFKLITPPQENYFFFLTFLKPTLNSCISNFTI